MELKPEVNGLLLERLGCLNRTFYGIETSAATNTGNQSAVLIVPFMELKLVSLDDVREQD